MIPCWWPQGLFLVEPFSPRGLAVTLRRLLACAGKILAFGSTGPLRTAASLVGWPRRSEKSPGRPVECRLVVGVQCARAERPGE